MSQSPLPPAPACTPQFSDRAALKAAVDNYISQGCSPANPSCSTIQQYGHINNWCTSGITDMSRLFQSKTTFNQDIGNWDTSSVTTFYLMFYNVYTFDQDISGWNTSSATNMNFMFGTPSTWATAKFNQDIGGWDVSKVINFGAMFKNNIQFNQDISRWDTSSATQTNEMFSLARAFNQDISDWDMTAVISSPSWKSWRMFYGATAFNQNQQVCDIVRL